MTERDLYVHPGYRVAENGTNLGCGQGISLRDWFAGQALAAIADNDEIREAIAFDAYALADAMMAERARE